MWGKEEMLTKKAVIATWSGGKDSCFAAYRAVQQGYELAALANTVSHDYQRVRFHGLPASVIKAQAEALGVPLLQAITTPEHYEDEFVANLNQGITPEIAGVVFGDIFLEDCLAWAKKVCAKLGVKEIEPHWGIPSKQLLQEFVDSGFQAVIVSTQASILGKEWIGRVIDQSFYTDITRLDGVDPCGENGEYHSLVIDGPFFKQKIVLEQTAKVQRSGYWFLDIQHYHLQKK